MSTRRHLVHSCFLATTAELSGCNKPKIFTFWPREFANLWLKKKKKVCFLLMLHVHLQLAGPLLHIVLVRHPSWPPSHPKPTSLPWRRVEEANTSQLQGSTRKKRASLLCTDLSLNQVPWPRLTSREAESTIPPGSHTRRTRNRLQTTPLTTAASEHSEWV